MNSIIRIKNYVWNPLSKAILDSILFYLDIITDILSLLEFVSEGFFLTYVFLFMTMFLERMFSIFEIAKIIKTRSNYATDPSLLLKFQCYIYSTILCFLYLDQIYILKTGLWRNEYLYKTRVIAEKFIEAMPSSFIAMNYIFYVKKWNIKVLVSILISIISANLGAFYLYEELLRLKIIFLKNKNELKFSQLTH